MNMKKGILLAAVILLGAVGFAQAQEELSGTIDVTYQSAYLWYGFDMYPGAHGEGVILPSIDLDLYGTGLGLNVLWSRANTGAVNKGFSFENQERIDITLSYSSSLLEYETYATDYSVGWMYYEYPDEPSDLVDMQEFFATLSWPEICPEGIVPSYTILRLWKSESGHPSSQPALKTNDISGWIHILGLGYDLPVESLLPDIPEQILHLSAAVVYNEGAGGINVDHDWSHLVLGVSTDFDLGNDLTLTPGVYHQNTFERSVNGDEDVTWASLSLKYAF
jgi:hypothetical protein